MKHFFSIFKQIHYCNLLIILLLIWTNPAFSQEIFAQSDSSYKVVHYANETLYIMNPDGSEREELLYRPDVLGFIPLHDGRILIHSIQYDGQALEIFNPESKNWVLVEFIEGTFPNIDVSPDGSSIVYETKRIPISIDGDGIWLYGIDGRKTHVKISSTAFSIESILIHDGQLHMLYHELDLIKDDAGLFLENIPVTGQSKRDRYRAPQGTKMLLNGGYIIGFAYPPSGRVLELKHLTRKTVHFTHEIPAGDIVLSKNGFFEGRSPVVCLQIGNLGEDGSFKYETRLWYVESNAIWDLEVNDLFDLDNFNWSPDGWLYFSAKYIDPSGDKSGKMLFRYQPRQKILNLVSVNGGMVHFIPDIKKSGD